MRFLLSTARRENRAVFVRSSISHIKVIQERVHMAAGMKEFPQGVKVARCVLSGGPMTPRMLDRSFPLAEYESRERNEP